jgi:putative solute:sodium symporter small subunit
VPEPAFDPARRRAYFRANLRLIGVLLAIWAVVSFGCGILLAPWLDQWMLPGTSIPLGFWFAQQGSIVVFCLLIVVYVIGMNRLDRRFGVSEGD